MVFSGKRSVEDAVKNFTVKVDGLLINTGENRKGE
jgi:hypothetical protein